MSVPGYTASVLLPAYRRGPHVELTALSWVRAWLRAGPEAPRIFELVIVDDDAEAGVPGGAVDWGWLQGLGEAAGRWLREQGQPTWEHPQEMLRIHLAAVRWPPGAKTSKASVASLNHAASVARGSVLVLSNAESAVLTGPADWPGRQSPWVVEREVSAPPARHDSDPRVGAPWWPARAETSLEPFLDMLEVSLFGGYTVGSCVNVGKGQSLGGIDHPEGAQSVVGSERPWWTPQQLARDVVLPHAECFDPGFLRGVPPRPMRGPNDHAWRSHPAWRPTDLHWASLIRRDDFWALGGFSSWWHLSPTGWGEDGEFAWRVRLWCEGTHEGRSREPAGSGTLGAVDRALHRPFRVSTRTVVAHQWHPSAGGDAAATVAFGESVYDLARWDAWRQAGGRWGLKTDWADPARAFPGATVVTQHACWRWHT